MKPNFIVPKSKPLSFHTTMLLESSHDTLPKPTFELEPYLPIGRNKRIMVRRRLLLQLHI
jgi:hypothetical protein